MNVRAFSLKTETIFKEKQSIFDLFVNCLRHENAKLQAGDIVIISSKIVSFEEGQIVDLNTITPSKKAENLAKEVGKDPRLVHLILKQSKGGVYQTITNSILSTTKYGMCLNAGIDTMNIPENHAILLPKDANESAFRFRAKLKEKYNLTIPIIISDTRTLPLRKGTGGVTIGLAGIDPIKSEVGKKDLFGKKYKITKKAIADGLASFGNLLMGETNEKTPFVIIQGMPFDFGLNSEVPVMPVSDCIYFHPFLKRKRRGALWKALYL